MLPIGPEGPPGASQAHRRMRMPYHGAGAAVRPLHDRGTVPHGRACRGRMCRNCVFATSRQARETVIYRGAGAAARPLHDRSPAPPFVGLSATPVPVLRQGPCTTAARRLAEIAHLHKLGLHRGPWEGHTENEAQVREPIACKYDVCKAASVHCIF
jgi:hypothetical protein